MITVYGTLCLDRLHRVPNLPKPGGYVEISETQTTLGGEAYNTFFSLYKWQHPANFIPNEIGRGAEAEEIKNLLTEQNISRPANNFPDQLTPVCDIYVTPDGERTMFGIGFANLKNYSDREDAELIMGDWFTCDPNLAETSLFFAEAARKTGARIYFMDFETEGELAPDYAPTDIWQTSTDRYGKKGDLQANLSAIEQAHLATGCLCLLTDSKNGFVICGPELPATHFPPFRASHQIDSTGAGDCFRAGLLLGLDNGQPLPDALAFAAAAASLACQGFGATASIPSLADVQNLLTKQAQTLLTYRQLGS